MELVTLVGLMGVGKSTVGAALASRWGWCLRDLDDEVAVQAGCTITEIFREHGEAAFRQRERETLRRLLVQERRCVIATGGGAPCSPGVTSALLEAGPMVWLRATPESLAKRIVADASRPLIEGLGERQVVALLEDQLLTRASYYARATVDVMTDDASIADIVTRIEQRLAGQGLRP